MGPPPSTADLLTIITELQAEVKILRQDVSYLQSISLNVLWDSLLSQFNSAPSYDKPIWNTTNECIEGLTEVLWKTRASFLNLVAYGRSAGDSWSGFNPGSIAQLTTIDGCSKWLQGSWDSVVALNQQYAQISVVPPTYESFLSDDSLGVYLGWSFTASSVSPSNPPSAHYNPAAAFSALGSAGWISAASDTSPWIKASLLDGTAETGSWAFAQFSLVFSKEDTSYSIPTTITLEVGGVDVTSFFNVYVADGTRTTIFVLRSKMRRNMLAVWNPTNPSFRFIFPPLSLNMHYNLYNVRVYVFSSFGQLSNFGGWS